MEEQVGDTRRHTRIPPKLSEVPDSVTIRPGEHVVVGTLAGDTARQQFVHRFSHADLPAFAVLGGTRLQPDGAAQKIHLRNLHLAKFADSPPVP